MWVVLNSFARNGSCAGLGQTLRVSCATIVPFEFLVSFLVRIDIHLLSIDFPLNPKGNQRISKIFNSCAGPCIFLSENNPFVLPICLHSMLVFLAGRHGPGVNFGPKACEFLA